MSHEWNCRCPRCEADEAKYEREDELEPAERWSAEEAAAKWQESVDRYVAAKVALWRSARYA